VLRQKTRPLLSQWGEKGDDEKEPYSSGWGVEKIVYTYEKREFNLIV